MPKLFRNCSFKYIQSWNIWNHSNIFNHGIYGIIQYMECFNSIFNIAIITPKHFRNYIKMVEF